VFIELLLLIVAIPVGFLIAWLAKDELVSGKKYFRILIIISIIVGIWFWLTGVFYVGWTMGFIFIVSLISLIKADTENKR